MAKLSIIFPKTNHILPSNRPCPTDALLHRPGQHLGTRRGCWWTGQRALEGYHVDGRHRYSKQDLGAQSDEDSVDRSGRRRLEAIGLERGGGGTLMAGAAPKNDSPCHSYLTRRYAAAQTVVLYAKAWSPGVRRRWRGPRSRTNWMIAGRPARREKRTRRSGSR